MPQVRNKQIHRTQWRSDRDHSPQEDGSTEYTGASTRSVRSENDTAATSPGPATSPTSCTRRHRPPPGRAAHDVDRLPLALVRAAHAHTAALTVVAGADVKVVRMMRWSHHCDNDSRSSRAPVLRPARRGGGTDGGEAFHGTRGGDPAHAHLYWMCTGCRKQRTGTPVGGPRRHA